MMLMKVLVVVVLELFVASVNAEYVSVTSSSSSICKTYYLSKYETLTIQYSGARLTSDCEIKVVSYGLQNLCVEADSFEIGSCDTTVKYYAGTSSTYMSLKENHGCYDSPSKWCPGKQYIKITITKSSFTSSWDTDVGLEVSQTDDSFSDDFEDIAHSVVLTTYVIIGIVVGAIVLIGIVVTIIICCVCNRRRSTSGTVYRNPQQATNLAIQPPTGSYPTAATTNVAYPYPQPGAYPQAGYQPPAQAGYQPGYQPPPQTAGFQTAPNTDNKPASAPPSEFGMQPVQPPPYSEN